MNTRTLLTVVLVAGLVLSAVGATTATQIDSSPTAPAEPAQAQAATPPSPDASGSSASASSSSSGSSDSVRTSQATDPANYTRLYIDDRHRHLELKPGESETVTVTVENGEEESVELSPRVVVPPRGQPPIENEWVSIEAEDTTLDAGESREFEITVEVPSDAEIRNYGGQVVFTDETIQYPGRPAQPVHHVSLNVEVWQEPTVHVKSDRYGHAQVKAGESFTREITVENTGDKAVPVNPQVNTDQHRRSGPADRATLDRSWIEIDAPNEIGAGETETIEMTVSPPSDADRGDYSTEVDLGLKDPTRNDQSSYWQQTRLHFQVWSEPETPFETSFDVSEDANSVVLELSGDHRPRGNVRTQADFDVTFVAPDGTEIDPQKARVTNRGHVNLGEERRPGTGDGTYATGGDQRTVQYEVTNPDSGTWTAQIMPKNTIGFNYEITRNED